MIDPTTNQSAAVADSFAVWDPEVGGYVDLRTSITGNAPAGLKTIQQLAGAINNDPVFAVSVDSATADLAADIATKAPIANPTFTGTVSGVSKSHVGLSNVDNTSDAQKPVSTATQTALGLKANTASPVFTGIPTAPALKVFNIQTSSGTSTKTGNPVTDFLQIRNEANQLIASFNGANMTASLATTLTMTEPAYFNAVDATSVTLNSVDLQTTLNDKQRKFITGPLPVAAGATTGRLFDMDGIYFRCLQANGPLSISTTGNSHLSLSSDTYSKGEIDGMFQQVGTVQMGNVTAAQLNLREWTVAASAPIVKTLAFNPLTGGFECGLSLSPNLSVTSLTTSQNVTASNIVYAGVRVQTNEITANGANEVLINDGLTVTAHLESTRPFDATTGEGQIFLNGANGNRIDFAAVGGGPPTVASRSVGTKLVLFPSVAASTVDYGLGIESNAMWSSVPSSSAQFRWYGGPSLAATLSGAGDLSVTGAITTNGVGVQTKPYVALRITSAGSLLSGNNHGQVPSSSMSLQAGRMSGQVYPLPSRRPTRGARTTW